MLFKFKSKAASDLIMLEADARSLLKIMIGDDPVQGIVLAKDLSFAIAALESAVAKNKSDTKQRTEQGQAVVSDGDDMALSLNAVSLTQRATPMLKLLRRSLEQNADVVWGV